MSGQIRPAPQSLYIRLWHQQNHSEMGDEQHCGCMRKTFWIYNTSILQVYRAVELMMFSKSWTAASRSRPPCSSCLNVGNTCFCVYWLTPTGLFCSEFFKNHSNISESFHIKFTNIKSNLYSVTGDGCKYFHMWGSNIVLISQVRINLNQLIGTIVPKYKSGFYWLS